MLITDKHIWLYLVTTKKKKLSYQKLMEIFARIAIENSSHFIKIIVLKAFKKPIRPTIFKGVLGT